MSNVNGILSVVRTGSDDHAGYLTETARNGLSRS